MKLISIITIAMLALILMAGVGSAASGDGTMIVSPTSVTAGSTGNNFIFTFNNQGYAFTSGSKATIDIPSSWTLPQKTKSREKGYVSVTANGATNVDYSIKGRTITVNFRTTNQNNKGFKINYINVDAPKTSGNNIFTTKTKNDGGLLINIITTQPTVNVKPNHADKLAFASQPSDTVLDGIISPPVKVQIQDHYNNLVIDSNTWVTVAIYSNPGHGTLSGTKSRKAINGVATFDDLSINKAGTGYTLKASSSGLSSVTSSKFDIKVNPPTYTHTITPSPMVGVRVKDTVTSTSTSKTDMEFKWIRPDGHTASTDSVPRSHDDTYVDSYKPNVAGLWTINVKEFDRHHVKLGESSTSFTVTENSEFGKLGAVLPLFTIGFIYMNYRRKFNK